MVTALKKVEGVIEAQASYNEQTATVTFDPTRTNTDKIAQGLRNTKYSAAKVDSKAKRK